MSRKVARNAEYTREYNRKLMLRILRKNPISRAEIARLTGLTRASVSLIATELLEEEKIKELRPVGGQRGRMPTPLAICNDAGYALGIYLNRDGCTVGMVDISDTILEQERVRLETGSREQKLEELRSVAERLIRSVGVAKEKIWGIGISAPGPLDGEKGEILNPPMFDLWHNTSIGPWLSEKTGLPVLLENNATCLASYYYDNRESGGSENFLLLLVDSGIGSGIISKGKILKGAGYFTSEVGHISINYRGKTCPCGNIGCLEAYAAIPNLLRGTGFPTWRELVDASISDQTAQELIRQEAEYLSTGVISLNHIINIDTVILAGEVLYGADRLIPLMQDQINSRSLRRDSQAIRVLPGKKVEDIRILSSANIVFARELLV